MAGLILSLVETIKEQFPEVQGRVIPVSDVAPFNKETVLSSFPLVCVGLVVGNMEQANHGGRINLRDQILVSFMFETERYTTDGKALPFYAFYDYEPLRDKLLATVRDFNSVRVGKNGGPITPQRMTIESDELCVNVNFTFQLQELWCSPVTQEPVEQHSIITKVNTK